MIIKMYDNLFQALKKYNDALPENYGNIIYDVPPRLPESLNTIFPLTIFQETNNISNSRFMAQGERVSTVGYSLNIYATNKGQILNQKIARELAEQLDNFLTSCGLSSVSYNANLIDENVYCIIITYYGNLYENKIQLI